MPQNNPCDNCEKRKAYEKEIAEEAQAKLERIRKIAKVEERKKA